MDNDINSNEDSKGDSNFTLMHPAFQKKNKIIRRDLESCENQHNPNNVNLKNVEDSDTDSEEIDLMNVCIDYSNNNKRWMESINIIDLKSNIWINHQ